MLYNDYMRSGYFTSMPSAPGSTNYTNPTNILKSESNISKDSTRKTLSSSLVDTYYIWSFDGKLLAEYDHNGVCVKDYIYVGNKLLAEYHPQTGKYYYHMSDQINSTRIVTDDDGNVVYSAAHGPYGDIQKTWVNTYDPKQKFSGKERESYSDLDYFGARYYDNHSYRFISVDPIKNREEAIVNPQLWNLYSYCRNNPITFIDPDGKNNRKPGKTPPSEDETKGGWPKPPENVIGKKPKWDTRGFWKGKKGRSLTWDNRSHGAGVDRGEGVQDGHWDDETSNERWDRYGNPLTKGENNKDKMRQILRKHFEPFLNPKPLWKRLLELKPKNILPAIPILLIPILAVI